MTADGIKVNRKLEKINTEKKDGRLEIVRLISWSEKIHITKGVYALNYHFTSFQ